MTDADQNPPGQPAQFDKFVGAALIPVANLVFNMFNVVLEAG